MRQISCTFFLILFLFLIIKYNFRMDKQRFKLEKWFEMEKLLCDCVFTAMSLLAFIREACAALWWAFPPDCAVSFAYLSQRDSEPPCIDEPEKSQLAGFLWLFDNGNVSQSARFIFCCACVYIWWTVLWHLHLSELMIFKQHISPFISFFYFLSPHTLFHDVVQLSKTEIFKSRI